MFTVLQKYLENRVTRSEIEIYNSLIHIHLKRFIFCGTKEVSPSLKKIGACLCRAPYGRKTFFSVLIGTKY